MKPHGERTQSLISHQNISARALARFKRRARQFRNDTQGQVALLFGLVAIPMFVAGGMAVDMARHGFPQTAAGLGG